MKRKALIISGNLFPAISGDSIYSQGLIDRLFNLVKIDVCAYGSNEQLSKSIFNERQQFFSLINRSVLDKSKIQRLFNFGSIKQVYTDEMFLLVKNKIENNDYDYIIIDHLRVYSIVRGLYNLIKSKKIKIIYVAHNIEYVNLEESIKFEKNIFNKILMYFSNFGLKKLEQEILQRTHITWALTHEDKNKLKTISNKCVFYVVPTFFRWKKVKNNESLNLTSKTLLILGSMNWYPNVIGTTHFVKEVFNKIIEIDADFKLYIVGQKPTQTVKNLSSNSVIVTGRVESVDEYIKKSDVLIIPNKLGSGIKIKFYEAVFKGIPVICYEENIVGYYSKLLKKPFVVNNENDFVSSIFKVYSDFELKKNFLDSFVFENKLDSNIFIS